MLNKKEVKEFLNKGGDFNKIPSLYKEDIEIIYVALSSGSIEYKDLTNKIKSSHLIAAHALKIDSNNIQYLPNELKNKKDLIMPVLAKNGLLLKYAGEKLKSDKEVLYIAITDKNRNAVWNVVEIVSYASVELKKEYNSMGGHAEYIKEMKKFEHKNRLKNDNSYFSRVITELTKDSGENNILNKIGSFRNKILDKKFNINKRDTI